MKKILSCFSTVVIFLFSCKKDIVDNNNTSTTVPPVVNYVCIDSMKVDTFIKAHEPDMYEKYKGKIYKVESTNTLLHIKQQNSQILIFIVDDTAQDFRTATAFLLNVKSINDFSGTYSLKDTSITRPYWNPIPWNGQFCNLYTPSGRTIGAGYRGIIGGSITLSYNSTTNTVNGSIENLKIPWGIYTPDFISGGETPMIDWFIGCGSSRNINVSFKDVPFKK